MGVESIVGLYQAVPTTVTDGKEKEVLLDAQGRIVVTSAGSGGVAQGVVVLDEFGGDPLDYTIPADVQPAAATSVAVTSVPSQATDIELLAAAATRLHGSIVNSDANALCIKIGGVATITDYSYRIAQNGTWEMPYRTTATIHGIWEGNGAGAANITSYLSA